jgi:hypothetical protein
MTYIVIFAFVAILGSLGLALRHMMRGSKTTDTHGVNRGMAWALTVRIGLSVLLFAFILFSYWMGWIHPTGIAPGR